MVFHLVTSGLTRNVFNAVIITIIIIYHNTSQDGVEQSVTGTGVFLLSTQPIRPLPPPPPHSGWMESGSLLCDFGPVYLEDTQFPELMAGGQRTLTWHRNLNDLAVWRLRFNPLQRNAIC